MLKDTKNKEHEASYKSTSINHVKHFNKQISGDENNIIFSKEDTKHRTC